MKWYGRSAYAVGAVFSVLLACGNGEIHEHDNLREDVLYCEEAVSALKACCPNFDSRSISCEYSYDYFPPSGCGANDSRTYSTKQLGLGARVADMVAFYVALDGDFGRTRHGLTTRDFTLAPSVELVAERFRLSFGPEIVWFGISRATTGATIAHGGIGARVSPSTPASSAPPASRA